MLRPAGEMRGMSLSAEDGDIGTVDRFFFDDERWTIRHIVVDLGKWLPGRRVLISPVLVSSVDDAAGKILVRATMEKVRQSPDIDTDKPVSRQQEIKLHSHYGYAPYWGGGGLWGSAYLPSALLLPVGTEDVDPLRADADLSGAPSNQDTGAEGDSHLRSTKEVSGYHLATSDGEVGHVDDFVIDDDSWAIRFLLVDTSNWPGGRHVLVPAEWVESVDWGRLQISVGRPSEAVLACQEYRRDRLTSPSGDGTSAS